MSGMCALVPRPWHHVQSVASSRTPTFESRVGKLNVVQTVQARRIYVHSQYVALRAREHLRVIKHRASVRADDDDNGVDAAASATASGPASTSSTGGGGIDELFPQLTNPDQVSKIERMRRQSYVL